MFVVDDERFHVFDVDSEKLRTALSDAGYKVGMIADHVPYDRKGNVIDGPAVRDIVRAIKEGRGVVPPSTRPSPKKATPIVEVASVATSKPVEKKALKTKKKALKKTTKGGAK
jgi:hypothetical protein